MLALVLAVLLVSYAYPLRTWFEQRGERVELEREAARLEASVERLERERRLWNDPVYVAALARERLGFIMPGEQGYVVVSDGRADDMVIVDEDGLPPAGEGEWYERLWTSVQVADSVPSSEEHVDGSSSSTEDSDPADGGASPEETIGEDSQ